MAQSASELVRVPARSPQDVQPSQDVRVSSVSLDTGLSMRFVDSGGSQTEQKHAGQVDLATDIFIDPNYFLVFESVDGNPHKGFVSIEVP